MDRPHEGPEVGLARVITDAMVNIAQTTPETTIIVFEDIARRLGETGQLAAEDS